MFRKSNYDGKATHNGNQEQITILNPVRGRSLTSRYQETKTKTLVFTIQGTTLSSMVMKTIQMWDLRLNIDKRVKSIVHS